MTKGRSATTAATAACARYVIIDEPDAPEPRGVCQWVAGTGYCYLDRGGTHPDHDGMRGAMANPVEAFGFAHTENRDGTVSFCMSERAPTATYADGEPRPWQSAATSFERRRLRPADVARKAA